MLSEEAQRPRERYLTAAHAMQSAVAYTMQFDPAETTPKHLRVGVNSALVDQGALVSLLVAKGLVTYEELYKTLADKMEEEVESYKLRLPEDLRERIRFA